MVPFAAANGGFYQPPEVPHLGLPHSARLRSVERADAVRDEARAVEV